MTLSKKKRYKKYKKDQILEFSLLLAQSNKRISKLESALYDIRHLAIHSGSDDEEIYKIAVDALTGMGNKMFTKEHMKAVAAVIKAERQRIDDKYPGAVGTVPEAETRAMRSEHEALSNVEAAFIKTFKADNPKFEPLLFIGDCGYSRTVDLDNWATDGVFRKYT